MDIEAIIQTVSQRALRNGVNSLNVKERTVYLIAKLDFECACNGLSGWYINWLGPYADELVEALDRVGCPKSAECIRKANALFSSHQVAPTLEAWSKACDSLSEDGWVSIGKLGNEFLSRPDDLAEKYEAFIHSNRESFET
jgi:hypothetical protein